MRSWGGAGGGGHPTNRNQSRLIVYKQRTPKKRKDAPKFVPSFHCCCFGGGKAASAFKIWNIEALLWMRSTNLRKKIFKKILFADWLLVGYIGPIPPNRRTKYLIRRRLFF